MKVSDFDFESDQTNRWYAFTPLIIFFTIVPFVVISKIWSTLNSQGGIDVSKACEAAKIYQSITDSKPEADRQEVLRHIIRNLKIVDSSKQDRPMYEGKFNSVVASHASTSPTWRICGFSLNYCIWSLL